MNNKYDYSNQLNNPDDSFYKLKNKNKNIDNNVYLFESLYLNYINDRKDMFTRLISIFSNFFIIFPIYIFLSYTPNIYFIPNLGFFVFLFYSFLYFYIKPKSAIFTTIIHISFWVISYLIYLTDSNSVYIIGLMLFISGNILQIFCFISLEKRNINFIRYFIYLLFFDSLLSVSDVLVIIDLAPEYKTSLDHYKLINQPINDSIFSSIIY